MVRRLSLAFALVIASLSLPGATHAADRGRFFDPSCDVYGHDYPSDEEFDDACTGIDIAVGRVVNTERAIRLDVIYRDLNAANTDMAAPYVLWLDTDDDPRPDWRLRFAGETDFKELGAVSGWDDTSPAVTPCVSLSVEVSAVTDSTSLAIPHRCIQTEGAFRFNLQSRNRSQDGLSWERDCFPEVRTWSAKTRHD